MVFPVLNVIAYFSKKLFPLFALLIVVLIQGCAIQQRPANPEFDALQGKGPIIIVPNDEQVVSTKFFREKWGQSKTIKHLVTRQGVPKALSVEREFLAPNRLKLFYPKQGLVYVLDQFQGDWLVAGSEPLGRVDLEMLRGQEERGLSSQPVRAGRDIYSLSPTFEKPMELELHEVTRDIQPSRTDTHVRGRLKPPSRAGIARLERDAGGDYLHTVSFEGESFSVLADWYLGDSSHADTLAEKNHMATNERLALGQRILLPHALLSNTSPLPEGVVPY